MKKNKKIHLYQNPSSSPQNSLSLPQNDWTDMTILKTQMQTDKSWPSHWPLTPIQTYTMYFCSFEIQNYIESLVEFKFKNAKVQINALDLHSDLIQEVCVCVGGLDECVYIYSTIHKAAGLTVPGRSEPKHAIAHASSCKKNGAGGCEITVPPSPFPFPFFCMQKSHCTERPQEVILYGGFSPFSLPIG